MVLLFGNAFSAYATAEALGSLESRHDRHRKCCQRQHGPQPADAYALAFGMIVIIIVTIVIYSLLQRRTSRWLR